MKTAKSNRKVMCHSLILALLFAFFIVYFGIRAKPLYASDNVATPSNATQFIEDDDDSDVVDEDDWDEDIELIDDIDLVAFNDFISMASLDEEVDDTAPVINSIMLLDTETTSPGQIRFVIDITEDGCGLKGMDGTITTTEGNNKFNQCWNFDDGSYSGEYELTLDIPKNKPVGTYKIGLNPYDKKYNQKYYFLDVTFDIVPEQEVPEEDVDTVAPVITGVSFASDTAECGDPLVLNVEAIEDKSGISRIEATIVPSVSGMGNFIGFVIPFEDSNKTGTYTIRFDAPESNVDYTLSVHSLFATDNAGNTEYYYPDGEILCYVKGKVQEVDSKGDENDGEKNETDESQDDLENKGTDKSDVGNGSNVEEKNDQESVSPATEDSIEQPVVTENTVADKSVDTTTNTQTVTNNTSTVIKDISTSSTGSGGSSKSSSGGGGGGGSSSGGSSAKTTVVSVQTQTGITTLPSVYSGSWEYDDTAKAWRFKVADGTYAQSQWVNVNGVWYLIDGNSNMTTGWQLADGKYYLMSESGAMKTGWVYIDGKWYYLDATSGYMWADTTTPDGYTVGTNGAWIED